MRNSNWNYINNPGKGVIKHGNVTTNGRPEIFQTVNIVLCAYIVIATTETYSWIINNMLILE